MNAVFDREICDALHLHKYETNTLMSPQSGKVFKSSCRAIWLSPAVLGAIQYTIIGEEWDWSWLPYMNKSKANVTDLIAATGLVIGSKSANFCPVWPWNLTDDLEQGKSEGFDSCDRPSNLAQIWSKSSIFQPVGPWNWCLTSKNNRAPLLYYIKLCVSFKIHRGIQTEVTLRKRSIRVKIGNFLSLLTLKFDGWPWKTTGHLFYSTSSFVHHFKSIGEFKLKSQSGNAQIRSKSAIFLSCVTLKFDGWPWKTIGRLFYTTRSFVHHFKSIGEFKLELQSGNAQFGSKSSIFCPLWPWNLMDDLEKP